MINNSNINTNNLYFYLYFYYVIIITVPLLLIITNADGVLYYNGIGQEQSLIIRVIYSNFKKLMETKALILAVCGK